MADFRSDTVTKPSAEMIEAMAAAEVGDDVYGDDPTVNALENRVAEMFGKEAALFAPTGSLTNQLAIRSLVKPGEELLTELTSHIVRAELGAGAAFSGITTRTWEGVRGSFKASEVMRIAAPDAGPYLVSTKAIAIENTHNFGGGYVQSFDEIKELRKASSAAGMKMHLDGARIWNAHIASGISFKDFGSQFDTISICFSKGLGAPIGSAVLSTAERIAESRIWRKRYGGGMRQIGFLAAAANFALDNNIKRLAQDHEKAKQIAIACAEISPTLIDASSIETNIVALDLTAINISAAELNEQLKAEGILAGALGPNFLRLVTHLDISDSDLTKVLEVLPKLLKRALVAE
ncbi:GLY1 Threonine aldolase [actinobacterium SCGC AAA044-D11]